MSLYEIDDKNGREEFSYTEWRKKRHERAFFNVGRRNYFQWGGGGYTKKNGTSNLGRGSTKIF